MSPPKDQVDAMMAAAQLLKPFDRQARINMLTYLLMRLLYVSTDHAAELVAHAVKVSMWQEDDALTPPPPEG